MVLIASDHPRAELPLPTTPTTRQNTPKTSLGCRQRSNVSQPLNLLHLNRKEK